MSNTLIIDQTALNEVQRERTDKAVEILYLRIKVEGGGCSGFQYAFDWDDAVDDQEDIVFSDAVVVDSLSLKYMKGSTIRFHDDMMGRMFKIDNPLANSACGCGTSFSV